MLRGLVGYTGFVGSNILKSMSFDELYNSKNIENIRNKEFDLLIFSGARAEKWIANAKPDEDKAHIDKLIEILSTVRAKSFVLISTVDVYKRPIEVNEDSSTEFEVNHAYGKNRGRLEQFCQRHFANAHILRLPGLFGEGIKKNVIYDFLNDNQTQKIDSRGSFQFYNLAHIADDIKKSIDEKIPLLNISVEPIRVSEIVGYCFGRSFQNEVLPTPASYNFKSKFDQKWGGHNGYLYTKGQVLTELKQFVQTYKVGNP